LPSSNLIEKHTLSEIMVHNTSITQRTDYEHAREVAREIGRIYSTLSSEGIAELAGILIPVKYKKSEVVLPEGEVCRYMYYVQKGLVRQYYYKNGKEVTEHFSYEGRIVMCIESLFTGCPSRLIIGTLENTVLWAIPIDAFQRLLEHHMELNELYRRILEHALISSQWHADAQRFERAADRYERLLEQYPELILRAPMHMIASYLQMTPETLSRIRNKV